MKRQVTLLLLSFTLYFIACNKSQDGVLIRVQNSTNSNFKEVIVGNQSFVTVNTSAITPYQFYKSIYDFPTAILIKNNNDTTSAGIVYDITFQNLPNGKYTLKIFDDTTLPSHYNCAYTKN